MAIHAHSTPAPAVQPGLLRAGPKLPAPPLLPAPTPLPSLPSALSRRRAIFGPHDLRDDRIRATSYLADDLSPSARRELRNRDGGLV